MKKIYWIPIIAFVLLVAVINVYRVAVDKALDRTVREFEQVYMPEEGKEVVDMVRVPGYLDLIREHSRLNNQLQMAKSDSIGLSLRLRDSVAELIVKGIVVTGFSLREVAVSPFFSRLSPESRYELLSEPWLITGAESTISREPLNVIKAPKDTSEIVPFVAPDTTHSEPVFITLHTDKGVDICFYQVERESRADKAVYGQVAWREAREQFRMFTDSIVHGAIPRYIPVIRLGMNKVDAKVLYRALPSRGMITMSL